MPESDCFRVEVVGLSYGSGRLIEVVEGLAGRMACSSMPSSTTLSVPDEGNI